MTNKKCRIKKWSDAWLLYEPSGEPFALFTYFEDATKGVDLYWLDVQRNPWAYNI